jgi:hypothetical protein
VFLRLETFFSFLGTIPDVILEGECVSWRSGHPCPCAVPESSLIFIVEWIGLALELDWLLGALLIRIPRITAVFIPSGLWPDNEFLQNRRPFLRLWPWAMALTAMEGFALFFGYAVTAP